MSTSGRRKRSWSQLEQYGQCPEQFRLARLEKVWQRPAAWTAMGTAVHFAAEHYERSSRTATREECAQAFREEYVREIDKSREDTPNTSFWESSGPYRGEEDIVRRMGVGLQHVDRYIDWYEDHPAETPLVLDSGDLAIELPFLLDMGGVPVRGVLDYLGSIGKSGTVGPRDNKTGAKPGKVKQLKLYGLAAEDYFEYLDTPRDVLYGDFFMTKTGKPTVLQNLAQVTRDEMVVDFQKLDAGVNAGDFPARPGEQCARCSVRDSCKYREG